MLRAGGSRRGNAYITGGSITGTNVPYSPAKSAIPFIKASSGTMGNNGALSAMTALPTTYTGAYIYLPANAIVAGSAAGWYWFVGSSTTAGTVYNSTYTSGIPVVGTTTAFATTGPGAFTGESAAVTAVQYTLTGGSIGANGQMFFWDKYSVTNNATAKTKQILLGGTAITAATSLASTVSWRDVHSIENRGSASAQIVSVNSSASSGIGASAAFIYRTLNTASDLTVARQMTGAAVDNVVLEAFMDEISYRE
jgi:hypothetical protein